MMSRKFSGMQGFICYPNHMIEVIHYSDKATEEALLTEIAAAYEESKTILPNLPDTLQIYFYEDGAIPETGVGAYAYSREIISLSIDPDYENKEMQRQDIRPTIFHEVFHIYQAYTKEDGHYNAIESATYEGMATVFERDYSGKYEPYADYSEYTDDDLIERVKLLDAVGNNYFEDDATWKKWAFYNHEMKERWIVYKVGTWIVDQVLQKNQLSIIDLKDKTAKEVLALFENSLFDV